LIFINVLFAYVNMWNWPSIWNYQTLESHESWNCLLTFFFCYNANGRFWFLLLTCTCDSVVITLSLLKSLIISNAWSISHVYICKRHINKDQYRFYVLNYLDFIKKVEKSCISMLCSILSTNFVFGDRNLNLVASMTTSVIEVGDRKF
jgi:hypothetical protein